MRDTYLRSIGEYEWTPVSKIPTNELGNWLIRLAEGNHSVHPDSPNGPHTPSDIRDRIMIELRARELGLV
jgi:hypothetical protein